MHLPRWMFPIDKSRHLRHLNCVQKREELSMPILYGAVAYREDVATKYEAEMNSWELLRRYEHPIACPKGCDKTYVLLLEINASDETAKEDVDLLHRAMERECPDHSEFIRFRQP